MAVKVNQYGWYCPKNVYFKQTKDWHKTRDTNLKMQDIKGSELVANHLYTVVIRPKYKMAEYPSSRNMVWPAMGILP